MNIASRLTEAARERPDALAIACPDGRGGHVETTFRELDEGSDRVAGALEALGVGRGVRTAVMVPPSLELFELTFALFKAGAVPVLVDPGMGVRNLGRCLAEAAPAAFIGIPRAHVARLVLGWGRKSVRHLVTVGRRLAWGGATLEELRTSGRGRLPRPPADARADETAAILFTSGSTGVPKGAVYTHGIFEAQVDFLRRTYDIRPGEVDLPTFPLFALFDPALGMSAIVPDMDPTHPAHVDPGNILGPIEKYRVTNMFGSPALIRRVGAHGAARGVKLPSLKRVISAGAPASPAALARFQTMLSGDAQVHTPYGATEALPVSSIGSHEILGETAEASREGKGSCVGRPVEGMDVLVIGITDEPIAEWSDSLRLPAGEIGEIVVAGPVVTREYFSRPDSTRLAKIAGPEGSVLHRMGDVGYLDERGRLWFCGRKSQRVELADRTLHTTATEGVFNAHPDVHRTALVGVTREGATRPVLCVELERGCARDRDEVREELLELGRRHAPTASIATVLFHRGFPVDVRHESKIRREELAVWAAGRLR